MEISNYSVPVKYNCTLFAPTPYFRVWAIWFGHLNFSPADPCCHGNEFWDKIDYNSVPTKDNCTLFSPTPYFRARTMQWYHVNFSPEDPCCHGNQSFLLKENWLQAHKSVKHWNAAARLYSISMGQILRSAERISSSVCIFNNPPIFHFSPIFHQANHALNKTFSLEGKKPKMEGKTSVKNWGDLSPKLGGGSCAQF